MRQDGIELRKIRLEQAGEEIADINEKIICEYKKAAFPIRSGMKIAVAVGSRGISRIDEIVSQVVRCLKASGAEPFLIPAMGSHGGAEAKGQKMVLEGYGITEERMGVPILSSMKVKSLGVTKEEPHIPVWMDENAFSADGVIAVNRVKAHTDFHGTHESGIVKMMAIGLGKQAQALEVHRYGAAGLRDYIPEISKEVIRSGKIIGALAILEDGYDRTADLAFAGPEEIFEVDKRFLERSKRLMARLPFEQIDVLIVDEMGKNISGTGMDTNVIGRLRIGGQQDGAPVCGRVVALHLTEESHGNALGIGLADVIPKELSDSVDWKTTYANVITSGFLERGFLPIVAETEKQAVLTALHTCGVPKMETARIVRIRNTMDLNEIYISRALWDEAKEKGNMRPSGEWKRMEFTNDGRVEAF